MHRFTILLALLFAVVAAVAANPAAPCDKMLYEALESELESSNADDRIFFSCRIFQERKPNWYDLCCAILERLGKDEQFERDCVNTPTSSTTSSSTTTA